MKQILFFFIITINLTVYCQDSPKYADLEKTFHEKEYEECLRLAEVYSLKDSGLPAMYKALCIYKIPVVKKAATRSPDYFKLIFDYLDQTKGHIQSTDSIPAQFVDIFQSIQLDYCRDLELDEPDDWIKIVTSDTPDNFEIALKNYQKVFDNSAKTYLDYYVPRFSELGFSRSREQTDSLKKNQFYNLAFSYLESSCLQIKELKPDACILSYLLRIQSTIQDLIVRYSEVKGSEKIIESFYQLHLRLFNNKSEIDRNYYIIQNLTRGTMDLATIKPEELALFNSEKTLNELLGDDLDFQEWDEPKYLLANTAEYCDYMTREEKNMILILNLCRMNPALFEKTFLKSYLKIYTYEIGPYSNSLIETLKETAPMQILMPDQILTNAAILHAIDYGNRGLIGHEDYSSRARTLGYDGEIIAECCSYGSKEAFKTICGMMVDRNLPSLIHRKIMLEKTLSTVGVSIEPHKVWNWNTVFDFSNSGKLGPLTYFF